MDRLLQDARESRSLAIPTYSEFPVGASLRCAVYTFYAGCNIEIVNYSNSLHAEEVAIARALVDGHREFAAVAVSGPHDDGLTPCGMCRQTLAEFCPPDFEVIVDFGDEGHTYTLEELLPASMTSDSLVDD
jgi:cytidine deaminase